MHHKRKIFLSYCSHDEDIAQIIVKEFKAVVNIGWAEIYKYTDDVNYKDSFKTFMNLIDKCDFVITLVSDSYLKSRACMYEVGELIKDRNFKDRIIYIVLAEEDRAFYNNGRTGEIAAKIYNNKDQIQYVDFWQSKYDELEKLVDSIKNRFARSVYEEDLKAIHKILENDINQFITYLYDHKNISLNELVKTHFLDVFKQMLSNEELEKIYHKGDTVPYYEGHIIEVKEGFVIFDGVKYEIEKNFEKYRTGIMEWGWTEKIPANSWYKDNYFPYNWIYYKDGTQVGISDSGIYFEVITLNRDEIKYYSYQTLEG